MPRYFELARKNGIGLLMVFVYSLLLLYYYFPNQRNQILVIGSVGVTLIVWLIAVQFNDQILEILTQGKLSETYIRIKINQGAEKDFYTDYDDDLQSELNDLDEKTHYEVVKIVSGSLISLTLPVVAVLEYNAFGIAGIVGGLLISAVAGYLLIITSRENIIEVLDYAARVSDTTNED